MAIYLLMNEDIGGKRIMTQVTMSILCKILVGVFMTASVNFHLMHTGKKHIRPEEILEGLKRVFIYIMAQHTER